MYNYEVSEQEALTLIQDVTINICFFLEDLEILTPYLVVSCITKENLIEWIKEAKQDSCLVKYFYSIPDKNTIQ